MKGLAAVFGPKPEDEEKAAPEADEEGSGGTEMDFARLASKATAAGDHDAAAKAIVGAIKACMNSYGSKE